MSAKRTKKTAAKGQKRRRVTPLWRRRWVLNLSVAALLAAAAGGAWWSWSSGWVGTLAGQARDEVVTATARAGLTVGEVLVAGRNQTTREDLGRALDIAIGDPILGVDLAAARRRVEALPWVREAKIDRLLPDTVLLSLRERKPLALWQNGGRFSLIDGEGGVIDADHLERFADLLVVVGEDAPAHAGDLLAILDSEPDLRRSVRAAVRVGGRRWDLRMSNGVDVRLPEEDAPQAWARLAAYQRDHQVLTRDVRVLDLRLPDRLIVRQGPESGTRRSVTGQET